MGDRPQDPGKSARLLRRLSDPGDDVGRDAEGTKAASKNKFPEFGWRRNWSSGSDGVVPGWADDVMLDVESLHLGVADLHSGGVVAGLKLGVHH